MLRAASFIAWPNESPRGLADELLARTALMRTWLQDWPIARGGWCKMAATFGFVAGDKRGMAGEPSGERVLARGIDPSVSASFPVSIHAVLGDSGYLSAEDLSCQVVVAPETFAYVPFG